MLLAVSENQQLVEQRIVTHSILMISFLYQFGKQPADDEVEEDNANRKQSIFSSKILELRFKPSHRANNPCNRSAPERHRLHVNVYT